MVATLETHKTHHAYNEKKSIYAFFLQVASVWVCVCQVSRLRELVSQVGARLEEEELEELFSGLDTTTTTINFAQFLAMVAKDTDSDTL